MRPSADALTTWPCTSFSPPSQSTLSTEFAWPSNTFKHEKSSSLHNRTVRSPLPVASIRVLRANRTLHTPRLCPLQVPSGLSAPLERSTAQIFAVLSCEPDTSSVPPGDESSALMSFSCARVVLTLLHRTGADACPSAGTPLRSQTLIVRSWLPVKRYRGTSSRSNTTAPMLSACPSHVATQPQPGSVSCGAQRRAELSFAPLASILPDELAAKLRTMSRCPASSRASKDSVEYIRMREEFVARATCSEDCPEHSNAVSMISSLKPIS
jgi:hypothetical protein